jgi:hypothetical protein
MKQQNIDRVNSCAIYVGLWVRSCMCVGCGVVHDPRRHELYNSKDKGREEGSLELLLQFHPKAFALHPTTGHHCSSFFLHIVFIFTQIKDNYDHSWDMSVYCYVFCELRVRHGC